MDNKPLEQLAEDYIKTRLAKAKIKFLKPNYDTDGTDLVLLNPLNKHLAKQVIIQSKGRNLTKNQSNVEIPQEYVVSNFICFLYLELDGDDKDYFYIFFYDDIKDWSLSNGKFTLSIPKGFKSHNYFNLHKFNSSTHTLRISELLNESPILRQSYVPFEEMSITEILFEMWKKYDSLPDLNLVQGLYDEFYELSGSFSMDIFLIYSIAMHIEKLEYRNLDGFMQDLYMARNLSKPISESLNIHNPEEIKYINSDWAIVYSRLKFGQVQVTYDGIDYKGLYCYIGDSEDHVEALLFDNGDYLCFGQRKFFSD